MLYFLYVNVDVFLINEILKSIYLCTLISNKMQYNTWYIQKYKEARYLAYIILNIIISILFKLFYVIYYI